MAALVVYLRSPNDSAVELEAQEEAIRAWARARRHRIVTVTFDTTADLEQRGGLAQALALIRDDTAAGLVVHRLDSLADDLIAQEQVLAEVHRLGARVHTVSGPPDDGRGEPADEMRRLVRAVLRTAAGNHQAVLALRSARRLREDGRSAAGSPAYGFRVKDGEVRPDPAEQVALARIVELHAAGATLRDMARTLHAEGYRPKRSEHWHPETLRRIVRRLQD
jgi:DNA invertase Pin-like site-specific DNA recombinase